MNIQILDLGINNLSSLIRALESIESSFRIKVVSSAQISSSTENADLLVLPGVGNFGAAMKSLRSRDLDNYIYKSLQLKSKVLGICLGMQLLLQSSEESPGESGLGLIPGSAMRLNSANDRVPNVGWNTIIYSRERLNLGNPSLDRDYYFTHSFYANVKKEFVYATSLHGKSEFPAVIGSELAVGIQFHPEKSGLEGKRFLKFIIESQMN